MSEYPFPASFQLQLESHFGSSISVKVLEALSVETPPVSIRLNKRKLAKWDELPLQKHPTLSSQVNWATEAYYLSSRPLFISDPLWHAGFYYVQEASSMILEQVLETIKSRVGGEYSPLALDACAAPGGKSTHLIDLLPHDSLLVSHEFNPKRARILSENLHRWGSPNTIQTQGSLSGYRKLKQRFDLIACDAPCSGEGMFRKDPFAVEQWNTDLVQHCSLMQKDVISDLWPSLKQQGYFIYSTCTFNPTENALQVSQLVESGVAEVVPLEIEEVGFCRDSKKLGYHALPHLVKGEGFYVCLLQKKAELADSNVHSKSFKSAIKNSTRKVEKQRQIASKSRDDINPMMNEITELIQATEGFKLKQLDGKEILIQPTKQDNEEVYRQIKLLYPNARFGLTLCSFDERKKRVLPLPAIAWNLGLKNVDLPRVELSQDELIKNARGEAIHKSCSKGFVLLTFQDIPISLGKSIGTRINSLQQKHQRIKKNIEEATFFSIFMPL